MHIYRLVYNQNMTDLDYYRNQLEKYSKILDVDKKSLLTFIYNYYPEDYKKEMETIFNTLFTEIEESL